MVAKSSSQSNIFMGIDVSKDTLDIMYNGVHHKIRNDRTSIDNFIKSVIQSAAIKLCVLESTGGYEKLVSKMLQQSNIPVHRVHPNRVHAFARASNHFAKTDKLDAKLLEKYAFFVADIENGDEESNDNIDLLQDLRKVERDLEGLIHANQCRIKISSGKAKKYINDQIIFAQKQLDKIREDIRDIIDKDDDLNQKKKLLMSCKGIGDKVASALISELPELGKLNSKEIASLTGVAPKTFESGKKTFKARISGGRFYLRKALYMSALVASKHCKRMKEIYERLTGAGKPAKVALVAIMRKLIVTANAMIRDKKSFC